MPKLLVAVQQRFLTTRTNIGKCKENTPLFQYMHWVLYRVDILRKSQLQRMNSLIQCLKQQTTHRAFSRVVERYQEGPETRLKVRLAVNLFELKTFKYE